MHDMLDPKGVMGVVDFYAKRSRTEVCFSAQPLVGG
jgi:hypothetical protein